METIHSGEIQGTTYTLSPESLRLIMLDQIDISGAGYYEDYPQNYPQVDNPCTDNSEHDTL